MIEIKIYYEDGDYEYTNVNMTEEEARDYYIGKTFNVGLGENDDLKKCVKIVNLDVADEMNGLTKNQKEILHDNLRAYKANFGYIRIEKDDCKKGFYVYDSPESERSYVQYAYNIDYLNGWLYGAVQANNHVIKSI